MSGKSRKTGFECPWSIKQYLNHVSNLSSILILFIQVIPTYSIKPQIIFSIFVLTLLFFNLYYLIKLTSSDPTDPVVTTFKAANSR